VTDQVISRIVRTFPGARVFITGHTGFKGSWLAAWLQNLGAEVTGYALPPESEEGHFSSLALSRQIHHIEGDTRDADRLRAAVAKTQPHFIFHLAAQPLVRRSYRQPRLTFETNVMGSVNLLEATRACEVAPVLIYVTSDKCYLDQQWTWGYRESDLLGGDDPYSASKACAELVFACYQQSYFRPSRIRCASVRAGNVIGGGDWSEDRIVPDCMRALREERPIQIRNPGAVRPWQHVLEPLSGYLALAAGLVADEVPSGQSWNFGPAGECHRDVGELVENVLQRWGSGSVEICPAPETNRKESQTLYLNCDKTWRALGWRARWNFQRTVEATVDWYRCWMRGVDAWKLTSGQICAYSEASCD
jgi:CDP-glucose 4,6-dehydratase